MSKNISPVSAVLAKKVLNEAVVSTVAGSGEYGCNDDACANASFHAPIGIVADGDGNLFVSDMYNNRIRKITPFGVVTTIAGSGRYGFSDGIGQNASFDHPHGIAIDMSGNIFVADYNNHAIRKITPAGFVTTVAGNGERGCQDGTGTEASFDCPMDVAIDKNGNLYVADTFNNKIRKITPSGVVTTIAGGGGRGYKGSGNVDDTGSLASFNNPQGIAIDMDGNLFVDDTYSNRIRKITPTGVVTTIAGSGYPGKNDGAGKNASFDHPHGIAIGSSGNLFVADYNNHTIRKITPSGIVTTIAGSGRRGDGDGEGKNASFSAPFGIAIDPFENIIVADTSNHKIRKIILKDIKRYSTSSAQVA
jgi:serine/threonine protein kinase, bacterial